MGNVHIPDLTSRELDILRLMNDPQNDSYGQIALTLFVSANTVKTHVMHIFEKLGVNSRSEAIRVGREIGKGRNK